jgi:hypothetical protein
MAQAATERRGPATTKVRATAGLRSRPGEAPCASGARDVLTLTPRLLAPVLPAAVLEVPESESRAWLLARLPR